MAYSKDLGKIEGKINYMDFGGTTYFLSTTEFSSTDNVVVEPTWQNNLPTNEQSHTFASATNLNNLHAAKNALFNSFLNVSDVKKTILEKNEDANTVENSENLPEEIDNSYHSICLIETEQNVPQIASTYKATHVDGFKYCLRRLHGCRLQSIKCVQIVEKWKKLQHSNIVRLKEVFTTKAFGDSSLILAYDYHPCSQNLFQRYFRTTEPFSEHRYNKNRSFLPENELWWIIMQVSSGLRAIHQSGLACRSLDPTKIIVTGNKRIRLSFLGISDIVLYDPESFKLINHYQQEDLTAFGKLMIALATKSLQSIQRDRIQTSLEMISRVYTADLRHLIIYLLSTTTERSITEIMPMIGARFYIQVDALQTQNDILENELAKELENERLYRLLVKLGSINDRPEFDYDSSWSETGDRYILKLFRHHLFHSVTENGKPFLSNSHIVQNLNKLDAGSSEKVQLISRDEQSVLVVTYSELKSCLDRAFQELVDASV